VEARDLLKSGNVNCCLVGGADSFLNEEDLTRLEGSFRLKSPDIPQGLIPGEGAAFLAVASGGTSLKTRRMSIRGIGLSKEDAAHTVMSAGHPTGRALISALHAALSDAQLPESIVSWRLSDLNGEFYGAIDSLLALSRVYRTRRDRLEICHPADCVGEIGAAAGALLIIVAATAMEKGYAPGLVAMCEGSSDSGMRAACLVADPAALKR